MSPRLHACLFVEVEEVTTFRVFQVFLGRYLLSGTNLQTYLQQLHNIVHMYVYKNQYMYIYIYVFKQALITIHVYHIIVSCSISLYDHLYKSFQG